MDSLWIKDTCSGAQVSFNLLANVSAHARCACVEYEKQALGTVLCPTSSHWRWAGPAAAELLT